MKANTKGVRTGGAGAGQYLQTNKLTKTARTGGVKFAPKPGLVQCSLCSRSFAKERIEVHGKICKKTSNKKRKPFDSVKVRDNNPVLSSPSKLSAHLQARVAGTEAAVYTRRGKNVGGPKVGNFTDLALTLLGFYKYFLIILASSKV